MNDELLEVYRENFRLNKKLERMSEEIWELKKQCEEATDTLMIFDNRLRGLYDKLGTHTFEFKSNDINTIDRVFSHASNMIANLKNEREKIEEFFTSVINEYVESLEADDSYWKYYEEWLDDQRDRRGEVEYW